LNKSDFDILYEIPNTEKKEKTFQTCQRDMERRTLQLLWSDRVTNAEVRQRINTKRIVAGAYSVKWKWRGHGARMDQRRWAHATPGWDLRIGTWRTERLKT
jgi:hypothetical protein